MPSISETRPTGQTNRETSSSCLTLIQLRPVGWWKLAGSDQVVGDLAQLDVRVLRITLQHSERSGAVEAEPLHQNTDRHADRPAGVGRDLEVPLLAGRIQRDRRVLCEHGREGLLLLG